MSWMVPKRMLDREQLQAINLSLKDKNCFIKGEPGTGKSIVLAHSAISHAMGGKRICVLTYTNALVSCLVEGLNNPSIPVMTFTRFSRERKADKYDVLFIDESQDLKQADVNVIKQRGNKFVLFGDFAQSLYGNCVSEGDLREQFDIRKENEFLLQMDYRLPRNIRELVQAIYCDRKFGAKAWRLMANAQIPLYHARDWDEEMKFVIEKAKNHAVVRRPVAILFESKRSIFHFLHTLLGHQGKQTIDIETVNEELEKQGLPFRFFGNGIGTLEEGDKRPLSYIMTWHSSKGLDFDTVILPNISQSQCRCNPFYVALTRARRNLVLTYSGRQNDQIEKARGCRCVCPIAADNSRNNEPTQGTLF